MSSVKVNVNVAGRSYPLTVAAEEETVLRMAGKAINESIKELETKYHISDRQDALAMCALQMASLLELNKTETNKTSDEFIKRILAINDRLDLVLEPS